MSTSRKRRSPALKAKVAIAAIKAQKTTSQLATEFGIHPSQIAKWKKQAIDSIPEIFEQSSRSTDEAIQRETASLYEQIGRLKVELDWIKKKSGFSC